MRIIRYFRDARYGKERRFFAFLLPLVFLVLVGIGVIIYRDQTKPFTTRANTVDTAKQP